MKDKIKNILLLVGFGIIVWMSWNPRTVTKEKTVTITLPAKEGKTEYIEVERVLKDTVYLPSKEKIVVDQKYKEMYEEAKDSLQRYELYLEAIRIKEYNKVFIDNDTLRVDGSITTRGSLLGYQLNYLIKENQFTYTPKVILDNPNLSIGFGVEAGVPTVIGDKLVFKGNLLIQRKNNYYSLSYDTNGVIWGGFYKTFKIY